VAGSQTAARARHASRFPAVLEEYQTACMNASSHPVAEHQRTIVRRAGALLLQMLGIRLVLLYVVLQRFLLN
jgi:hypothetical protein